MRPLLRLFAFLLASCNTAPAVRDDWRLRITTGGGITGRGAGSVDLEGARAPAGLASAVAAAHPERWQPVYAEPGNPYGYADQIHYDVRLTSGGRTHASSFYEGARHLVPADLLRVVDAGMDAG